MITLLARILPLLAALAVPAPDGPEPPAPAREDRVRLAEAARLAAQLSDAVWPDWSRTPFVVILVGAEREFLIGRSPAFAGYAPLGQDAILGQPVAWRPRTFPTSLLATFPIEGVSTVVVGRAETTSAKTSTPWVVSLLHEHFHQLQESQPDFHAKTAALGLARGDTSGMWMLEFPFPYDSAPVQTAFARASRALADALEASDAALPGAWNAYLAARRDLRRQLGKDDLAYLDFQLWKEGVARYTEIRMAGLAAARYRPSEAFAALPDFSPFAEQARRREELPAELRRADLAADRRIVFYAYGAGEAFLLDRVRPCWRDGYWRDLFTLDADFAPASPCEKVPGP